MCGWPTGSSLSEASRLLRLVWRGTQRNATTWWFFSRPVHEHLVSFSGGSWLGFHTCELNFSRGSEDSPDHVFGRRPKKKPSYPKKIVLTLAEVHLDGDQNRPNWMCVCPLLSGPLLVGFKGKPKQTPKSILGSPPF